MLESLALRGLCRCSSEELQFVFCPWAVEPCPPPSHGAWASWACEQRRGERGRWQWRRGAIGSEEIQYLATPERVAAMMGPDSQGVAAARHNRRCESWQLRWRASRGHGGAALRAVTNQRRWWVSSYPIRRIRSHKRGSDFVWCGIRLCGIWLQWRRKET